VLVRELILDLEQTKQIGSGREVMSMTKADAPTDGWSRSLWVSTAVKGLRVGWPAAYYRAREALVGSRINWRSLRLAAVFEDLWPSEDQLPDVIAEVDAEDIEALCRRETHHGRGLSEVYAKVAPGVEKEIRGPILASHVGQVARELGIGWLAPRALAELGCYLEARTRVEIRPAGTRSLDENPWTGMPPAMADRHASEGRKGGTRETILSGTPNGHVALMRSVELFGWDVVRKSVHQDEPLTH